MGADQRQPGAPVEFKLRCAAAPGLTHNIMVLGGPPVNISDFSTPVRLARDHTSVSSKAAGDADFGGPFRKQRRARLLPQPDDTESTEDAALKEAEIEPWVLEDFDGQHSFSSQPVVPDSKYVVFVNEGNEFRILLVSRWYRFTPRLAFRPLTIEEAEERLAQRNRGEVVDRWIMRRRLEESAAETRAAAQKLAPVLGERMRVARRFFDHKEEGFDFADIVDDDEGDNVGADFDPLGGGAPDVEGAAAPRAMRPASKNLSNAGRMVKKIVKHLDQPNYNYGDSDDDESFDPYADERDLPISPTAESLPEATGQIEQKQPERKFQPQPGTTDVVASGGDARSRPASPAKRMAPGRERSTSPSNAKRSRQRSISPASKADNGSLSRVSSGVSGSGQDGQTISEHDIISALRDAPKTTKELISCMKSKLRADPNNRQIFRDIVRRVAVVRPGATQDEDRLLDLRPEFR